jgi:hypothetical protein
LEEIGEVDARISHINGHFTRPRSNGIEAFDAHGFWCAGFGEHQAFRHG